MITATLKDKQSHDLIPGAEIVILTTINQNDYRNVYDPDLAWGKDTYDDYTVFHYRDVDNGHAVMTMPTQELSYCIKK